MTNNKKKPSKLRRIFNIIGYVLLSIIFVFLVYKIVRIYAFKDNTLFGHRFYTVQTDSMDPTIKVGDVILDDKRESYDNLQVGDIITFSFSSSSNIPNTHRIVGFCVKFLDGTNTIRYTVGEAGDSLVLANCSQYKTIEEFYSQSVYSREDYQIVGYITKGDNPKCGYDKNPVYFESVQGVYVRTSGFLTIFYKVFSSFWGFLFLILIPLILLLVAQVISMAKASASKEHDKKIEETEREIEDTTRRLRQQAIEEYLREQENNKNTTDGE